MMDGQVAAMRSALDGSASRTSRSSRPRGQVRERPVRPVREAAEGAPSFGDRTGYQEDPANLNEALREAGPTSTRGPTS